MDSGRGKKNKAEECRVALRGRNQYEHRKVEYSGREIAQLEGGKKSFQPNSRILMDGGHNPRLSRTPLSGLLSRGTFPQSVLSREKWPHSIFFGRKNVRFRVKDRSGRDEREDTTSKCRNPWRLGLWKEWLLFSAHVDFHIHAARAFTLANMGSKILWGCQD